MLRVHASLQFFVAHRLNHCFYCTDSAKNKHLQFFPFLRLTFIVFHSCICIFKLYYLSNCIRQFLKYSKKSNQSNVTNILSPNNNMTTVYTNTMFVALFLPHYSHPSPKYFISHHMLSITSPSHQTPHYLIHSSIASKVSGHISSTEKNSES